jgi:hypothetical protein
MRDEAIKPLVTITGERVRYLTSDVSLELLAMATAATCSPDGQTSGALRYMWSMACVSGPCILSPSLEQITSDVKTEVSFSIVFVRSYVLYVFCVFQGSKYHGI